VTAARWSSEEAAWTVTTHDTGSDEIVTIRCNFLLMCPGYYNYEQGYLPEFKGRDSFRGETVHPQHWPEGLDYSGKKVVIIGSGATAVTLLPEKTAYAIARWKNIQYQRWIYWQAKAAPKFMRKKLLKMARKELGKGVDFDKHFVPRYDPWEQRLCLVPNGDFFHAIRDGRASIVTDTIAEFTENGIRLESGEELAADIIVTATGLDLCVLGDVEISVDDRPVDIAETFSYKSMMFSDVPNLISTFGYINASWTLKADLTAEFSCRLLNHMTATGMRQCIPRLRNHERDMTGKNWIESFSSGYI